MENKKRKFEVYACERIIDSDTGEHLSDVRRHYLGDTFAVSEKKAISNVRFRFKNEKNPNGGYTSQVSERGFCTATESWYEAKEA